MSPSHLPTQLLLVAVACLLSVEAFTNIHSTNHNNGRAVLLKTTRPSLSLLRAETDGVAEDAMDLLSTAKEAFGDVTEEGVDAVVDAAGDMFASLSIPPELGIAAAAGVVGLIVISAIVSATSGGGSDSSSNSSSATTTKSSPKAAPKKKDPPKPKVDVSIPYDAAARLAFNAWVESKEGVSASEEAFVAFKQQYEEAAVALVTAKQMARELANFDPSKPKPKPRKVAAPAPKAPNGETTATATSTTETPFFAVQK